MNNKRVLLQAVVAASLGKVLTGCGGGGGGNDTLAPTDPVAAAPPPAASPPVATPNARSFVGGASSPSHPGANHDITFSIDEENNITGESTWPANPSSGGNLRKFVLTGSLDANGRLEMQDNGPEVSPGSVRGFYVGQPTPASGGFAGTYTETGFSMTWAAVPA